MVRKEVTIDHYCEGCNTPYAEPWDAEKCEEDCAKYQPRFTSEHKVIPKDGLGGKTKIAKWQIWNKKGEPNAKKIILYVLENAHIVREDDLISV